MRHPRVLHIISGDLWAGAEVQAFTLLRQLKRTGRIELHTALMNEGELCQRLRAQGIPVTVLDETRLSSAQILLGLRRLMSQLRPDLVHTHRIKENLLGTLASWASVRAPLVRTVHGAREHPTSWRAPLAHLRHLANEWTARHTTAAVIAVSEPLFEELQTRSLLTNAHLIPNGVDFDEIKSLQTPAPFRVQEPDKKHIGFIGRLEPVKRADLFLETARELCNDAAPDTFRFHLFGDGGQRARLQTLAETLAISEAVRFHGHTPDAVRWLGSLDAVVICSDHEGLPISLLECMAAGTPVAGHAVGGVRAIVDACTLGRGVTDHSSKGYARAVDALLSKPDPEACSVPADTVEAYSAERNAAQTAALYEALVTQRKSDASQEPIR